MTHFEGPLSGGGDLTIGAAAVALANTDGDGVAARGATIQVQDAAVRWRVDRTDPTATVGDDAEPGDTIQLTSRGDVRGFRAIRRDGANATGFVTLYAHVED